MSEHVTGAASATGAASRPAEEDPAFWNSLIREAQAARFLDYSIRTLQGLRYRGGGPSYLKMSSRCIRYRRSDLRAWAEQRLRTSTSDRGPEAARFLDYSVRTMQGMRYRGGGPRYIRMSSRCIRYRRSDLREWAEQRLRTSTSDPGRKAA